MTYDRIVIGAGIFGLYGALLSGKRGLRTLVLEADTEAMSRASFVNQARVHMGYHYPRSLSTANKSASYFERFCTEFSGCINRSFTKIYATSAAFSWTNAAEFRRFCRAANIPCEEVDAGRYFNDGLVDGAFLTTEFAFDAVLIRDRMLRELAALPSVEIRYGARVTDIRQEGGHFAVFVGDTQFETDFVFNATYASANEILSMAGFELFPTKYELCEIILGHPSEKLRDVGITVMDGPFFSVMPFGCTPYHSLTSVCFTPHATSYDRLPTLRCQAGNELCKPGCLQNCDSCPAKPKTAYPYMNRLAEKYLKEDYRFRYERSHFALKLILKASEVDDSRPTVIRVSSEAPMFVSVLSGKLNTIYDLAEVL